MKQLKQALDAIPVTDPCLFQDRSLSPDEARRLTRRNAWVSIRVMRNGNHVFREGPISARLNDPLCRVVFVGCFAYLYSEIKSWEVVSHGR
ncbi:hypothetical protein MXMO3_01762 [Maritalea myrionectae]|uniref:Uncharacterized protein n=1 Tax=Maritalea myrionectae TaxID=454601 RepID=A0A2R4ME28_9HYPH|nr:hypothetical protein [Maritalea myrionectae]AVX04287.1 hypothetical protein MXMO3_01762 [Maritalea myrionectae]